MAAAEDKSWEYTLGRIDERTENIEKRLTRVEAEGVGLRTEMHGEITTVEDAMLTQGTFSPVLGIVSSIIVALSGQYRFPPRLTRTRGAGFL